MVEKISQDDCQFTFNIQVLDDLIVVATSCESNVFEGNQLIKLFSGLLPKTMIIITCAVTKRYINKIKEYINRFKKYYPDYKVYVTGCGSNYYPEEYKECGNLIEDSKKFIPQSYGIDKINTKKVSVTTPKIRVQNGCSHNCAYCIIRLIKGKTSSLDYESIKKHIQEVIEIGWDKIILAGVDLTEYYYDGMYLSDLCRKILKDFPTIHIQTNNLDPAAPETLRMIELLKEESRMEPILHLPVQSGSNKILKLMRRRHTIEDLDRIYNSIQNTNINTYWDLIVGFPGETEEDFQETCNAIQKFKPTFSTVLPCCLHKGTEAYDMPDKVPEDIANERMNIAKNLIEQYSLKQEEELTIKITKENIVRSVSLLSNRETVFEHKKIILDFTEFYDINTDIIILLDNILYCGLIKKLDILFSDNTNELFINQMMKTFKNNQIYDDSIRFIQQ